MNQNIEANTALFRRVEARRSEEFAFHAGARDRITIVLQRPLIDEDGARLARKKENFEAVDGARLIVRHRGKEYVSQPDDGSLHHLVLGDDGLGLETVDHSGEYTIIVESHRAASFALTVARFDMTPPPPAHGKTR